VLGATEEPSSSSVSIQRSVGVVVLLVLCVLCAVDAGYEYHHALTLRVDPGEALRDALWRFVIRVMVLVGVAALTLRAQQGAQRAPVR
jgi:hypothetical protein